MARVPVAVPVLPGLRVFSPLALGRAKDGPAPAANRALFHGCRALPCYWPAFVLCARGCTRTAAIAAIASPAPTGPATTPAAARWKATRLDDRIRIELDGRLFTEYRFAGLPKPILYPIIGPTGASMTRHYPMVKNVPGESHDHPHHQGLWFGHEPVNGVNFWTIRPGCGKQVLDKIEKLQADADGVTLIATHRWLDAAGRTVCTDRRHIIFSAGPSARFIDYAVTLFADHGPVKLGDSKEGTMAIRTHPALRIVPLKNSPYRPAVAINSEGVTGKPIWGKKAKWVDYSAAIDGKTCGIALFDHPANLRHPTTWHAREYGLVAANPFGLSYFQKKPRGTGDYTIKAGDSLALRYRFVFHAGDARQARIASLYRQWAGRR